MQRNDVVELALVPTETVRMQRTELTDGCCTSTAAPVPHKAVK